MTCFWKKAMRNSTPTFSSTYLCETRFSETTHIKTKIRNKLDVTRGLRVSFNTSVESKFDKNCQNKTSTTFSLIIIIVIKILNYTYLFFFS